MTHRFVNPLTFPCPRCNVAVGEKCLNYTGKGKQPCPDRGQPEPVECKKCLAPVGLYVVRRKAKPLDHAEMICTGKIDHGAEWWAFVKKWWNVEDAPTPSQWIAPEKIALNAESLCGFCQAEAARNVQPGLFDEVPE